MEGIYIVSGLSIAEGAQHTGFVVSFKNNDYAISAFTACTMPFIFKHAAYRDLIEPQVHYCLTPINKIQGEE